MRPPSKMHIPFLASTTSSTPYMGLAGFPLLISRVDTGKSLSRSGTRRRQRFARAVANSTSLIRSPLASATLPPHSHASWIASSPAFTGKHACSTSMISLYSPPPGKSTSTISVKFSSDWGTLSWNLVLKNALSLPRRSATWDTAWQNRVSCLIRRFSPPSEKSTLPKTPRKSTRFWVLPAITVGMLRISQPSPVYYTYWPGKTRSSTGALSARTPSTASKCSSPPAPSLPSPTSAYLSVSIQTHRLQASTQSSLKSGKARSESSAERLALLTKRKRPTSPLSWNASPLFGPLRSSDHTSCLCRSRFMRTTMLCNG